MSPTSKRAWEHNTSCAWSLRIPRPSTICSSSGTLTCFRVCSHARRFPVREYPYGLVRIEFMGEITAGRVIFCEPNAEPLLGVTALESVGILVDPANKTLRRLPAIPLE